MLCENCYLLGVKKKNVKPHPQNGILVPLRGSFQNFRPAPPSYYVAVPLPGIKYAKLNMNLNHE